MPITQGTIQTVLGNGQEGWGGDGAHGPAPRDRGRGDEEATRPKGHGQCAQADVRDGSGDGRRPPSATPARWGAGCPGRQGWHTPSVCLVGLQQGWRGASSRSSPSIAPSR
jgi:hypothetical protein